MSKADIIIIILFVIVHVELLLEKYKRVFKKFRKNKKAEIIKSLATRQKEDELVVEKDKDITMIDEYVNYIKQMLENYNNSRNKKIALRTRQELLLKTIDIIPVASRHINLNYYYNLEDKEWYKLTDRDMMMLYE